VKFGIVTTLILFLARGIWNLTHFCRINVLQDLVWKWGINPENSLLLDWRARLLNVMLNVILEITPVALSLVTVWLVQLYGKTFCRCAGDRHRRGEPFVR
jgi:hypothetical protein